MQIGQDLNGDNFGDYFGTSVSLNSDGTVLSVGADEYIKVFKNINDVWQQIGSKINGEGDNDGFGSSISLNNNGTILAAGAGWNNDNGEYAGHARVYRYYEDDWQQIGTDIDGEAAGDIFGISVSLNDAGSVLAVGARGNDGNGANSGHVRVFTNNSDHWEQIGEDINGESEGDWSGNAVGLNSNGSIVSIGAWRNNDNGDFAGQVRVFSYPLTGIKKVDNKLNLSIYPNPTKAEVNIDFSDKSIKNLIITDITGKQIFEKKLVSKNERIDLSNFENGLYIIIIQTVKEVLTTKIIKR